MLLLFVCGTLRVAVTASYATLALVDDRTAHALLWPFLAVTLAVAVYDTLERRRRE